MKLMETKRIVISKWAKKHKHQEMEQVVYKTQVSDNPKKYISRTSHEKVKK